MREGKAGRNGKTEKDEGKESRGKGKTGKDEGRGSREEGKDREG